MQSVAVGWQIYELTHRALDLGLVGLAQFLPGICLFLLTGTVADHIPREKIVRTCSAGFALCSVLLLVFTLRHMATPYPLYAILLLNGTVRAFSAPASQAFLPLLLPRDVFQNAVAWNSSVFQTATIAGPMLGGILYGLTGSPVPRLSLRRLRLLLRLRCSSACSLSSHRPGPASTVPLELCSKA